MRMRVEVRVGNRRRSLAVWQVDGRAQRRIS